MSFHKVIFWRTSPHARGIALVTEGTKGCRYETGSRRSILYWRTAIISACLAALQCLLKPLADFVRQKTGGFQEEWGVMGEANTAQMANETATDADSATALRTPIANREESGAASRRQNSGF